MLDLVALNWFVAGVRYVISKDIASALESSSSDLDEDGRDNSANKVSHLIGMHQLFQIMRSVESTQTKNHPLFHLQSRARLFIAIF